MKNMAAIKTGASVMIFLVLSCVEGSALICSSDTFCEHIQDPSSFFFDATPSIKFTDGTFRLTLNTQLPVLCAVHHTRVGSDFLGRSATITTMQMDSPGDIHDVPLPFEIGSTYQVIITAFLAVVDTRSSP